MNAVTTERLVPTVQRRRTWPVTGAIILAVGLAVGIVTQIMQGALPDGWGVLANSGVMWALTAFALGATMPTVRSAAAGGAAELVIASIVYYAAVDWFEGNSSDPRGAIIWSAAGIIAGSVFATAGHWCARRADRRYPALALVSGVLFGEGIHLIWFAGNPDLRPAAIVELAIASTLLAFCTVRSRHSPLSHSKVAIAIVTIAATTCTLAALQLIDAIFMWA